MHTLEQHHNSNNNNTEKKIEGLKPVPQNQKEKQDQSIKIQQYVQANPASVSDKSTDYITYLLLCYSYKLNLDVKLYMRISSDKYRKICREGIVCLEGTCFGCST